MIVTYIATQILGMIWIKQHLFNSMQVLDRLMCPSAPLLVMIAGKLFGECGHNISFQQNILGMLIF